MENKIYGYVRVSSIDQNEDRQLMTLNKVNVPVKNICHWYTGPDRSFYRRRSGDSSSPIQIPATHRSVRIEAGGFPSAPDGPNKAYRTSDPARQRKWEPEWDSAAAVILGTRDARTA